MKLNEQISGKSLIIEERDRTKLPAGVLARITYPICNVGQLNANNRVYERDVWEKVLHEEDFQRKMASRTLYGQGEHPAETQSDLQLTSHVIFETWIDEEKNEVFQKLDILDTPTGRIINTLLLAECQVGVSTRAEGDLEEFELDEGGGEPKKCQRVVAETYNYVTTDFTADPSTYGVVPHKIERNVVETITALVKENKMTLNEKKFATQVLESVRCKECKCGGACKVQKLVSEMGGVPGEDDIPEDIVATAAELRAKGMDWGQVLDAVLDNPTYREWFEKEYEGGNEFNLKHGLEAMVGTLDEEYQELHPGKFEVVFYDGHKEVVDAISKYEAKQKAMKVYTKDTRISNVKELSMAESKLPECNLPTEGEVSPKVVAGNLLKGRDKSHWTVQEVGAEGMSVVKIGQPGSDKTYSWDEVPNQGFVKIGESSEVDEGLHKEDIVDHIIYLVKQEWKSQEHIGRVIPRGIVDDVISVVMPDIQELIISELEQDDMVVEAKKNESKNSNKDILNSLVDQKVSEAIAVAERDAAVSDSESIHLQYFMMQSKLNKTIGELNEALKTEKTDSRVFRTASEVARAEGTAVRKVLEAKAKMLSETKEALADSNKELTGIESQLAETFNRLEALTEAHKKELADSLDAGIVEGRQEVLKDYLEDKLSIHRLQIDDNSRTLLESCCSLQDVDSLMDKLIGIARKSALHSKPLTKVQIQEKIVVDPQENELDSTMGHLMERMG